MRTTSNSADSVVDATGAGACPPLFANAPGALWNAECECGLRNAECRTQAAGSGGGRAGEIGEFLPPPLEEEIREIYARSPLYAKRHPLPPTTDRALRWADYCAIPALTKAEIVARGHEAFFEDYGIVERGLQDKKFEYESTSGTTAGPMTVIMEDGWWNEQTRRAYRAHPLLAPFADKPHRKCVLAPVGCSSNLCPYEDFPFPNRYFDGTVYLNLSSDPFVFPEAEWDRIGTELQAVRPEVLEGEPIYLSLLARAMRRRRVSVPSVRVVILTYGKASVVHGRRIAEAFPGAGLVDLYGSTEAGYIFVGGAFGDEMRVIEGNAFVELVPWGGAVGAGGGEKSQIPKSLPSEATDMTIPNKFQITNSKFQKGGATSRAVESGDESPHSIMGGEVFEVLVTTRGRVAMPLLRYRTGDLLRRCARGFRVLGREGGVFARGDGEIISPAEIDAVIPEGFACWHYSLVQTGEARWDFHYVADEAAPRGIEEAIAGVLAPACGGNPKSQNPKSQINSKSQIPNGGHVASLGTKEDGGTEETDECGVRRAECGEVRVNVFRKKVIAPAASGKFALLKPLGK